MIKPAQMDETFLADVASGRNESDTLHLWWLGQSGFLLQWNGRHLLVDPYLSDSLTRKYAGTDKPHARLTERIVAPDRLDFIEVVTSSHNHTDHLDADTIQPLLALNPKLQIVVPEANRQFVADRLQIDPARPIGLDDGLSRTVAGWQLTGIASAHETVERDDAEHSKYLGYLIQVGPWKIYHSGDTVVYDGLAERLRKWSVDVALLPINGRAPERRVAGNLSGPEAAALAKDIGAKWVIPCHYEMFEFNTASPEEFMAECRRLHQAFQILRCGEHWRLS